MRRSGVANEDIRTARRASPRGIEIWSERCRLSGGEGAGSSDDAAHRRGESGGKKNAKRLAAKLELNLAKFDAKCKKIKKYEFATGVRCVRWPPFYPNGPPYSAATSTSAQCAPVGGVRRERRWKITGATWATTQAPCKFASCRIGIVWMGSKKKKNVLKKRERHLENTPDSRKSEIFVSGGERGESSHAHFFFCCIFFSIWLVYKARWFFEGGEGLSNAKFTIFWGVFVDSGSWNAPFYSTHPPPYYWCGRAQEAEHGGKKCMQMRLIRSILIYIFYIYIGDQCFFVVFSFYIIIIFRWHFSLVFRFFYIFITTEERDINLFISHLNIVLKNIFF